jgi:hypothetical protein
MAAKRNLVGGFVPHGFGVSAWRSPARGVAVAQPKRPIDPGR